MCTDDCPCKELDATAATNWIQFHASVKGFAENRSQTGYVTKAGGYATYKACVDATDNTGASTFFQEFAKSFREGSSYKEISDWIKFFEDEYDCAGICEVAGFYWSKDIAAGPPKTSCLPEIRDGLSSAFTGLGAVSFITGIFLLLIFIFQYCLWKKY